MLAPAACFHKEYMMNIVGNVQLALQLSIILYDFHTAVIVVWSVISGPWPFMSSIWEAKLEWWKIYYIRDISHECCLADTVEYITRHDDVIKWKHFTRDWPFVRGIHRSPVNSPHKGQWRGALMFTLICAQNNGWVNNREACDLRRYRAHYDVIVMASHALII